MGNIGTISFQSDKYAKWRNLFRYPDYKQSKFEKENSLINIFEIKFLLKLDYSDPYEGKRPVPVNRSFKVRLNDDLNNIGVGKVKLN